MIVTVTANAALDVTYEVPDVVVNGSHRVHAVRQRAGGKGVNVASVLARQGESTLATGLVAGATGRQIRCDLDARGIAHRFAEGPGESRRTVNVVSAATGDATIFNEPGPGLDPQAWSSLLDHVARVVAEAAPAVVVLSGSLPPGSPHTGYTDLATVARGSANAAAPRIVLDADGDALVGGLAAGPDLVKPNLAELTAATGIPDPRAAVQRLRDLGARNVVVSAGADGLLVFPADGKPLRAALAEPLSGNPTGAGDAAVAALARGLAQDLPWQESAATAVAWSAAAVLQPVAGDVDPDDVRRLLPRVQTEEIG